MIRTQAEPTLRRHARQQLWIMEAGLNGETTPSTVALSYRPHGSSRCWPYTCAVRRRAAQADASSRRTAVTATAGSSPPNRSAPSTTTSAASTTTSPTSKPAPRHRPSEGRGQASDGRTLIAVGRDLVRWNVHLARPETRLIAAAMMTAPKGNESHACLRAVRLITLVCRSVSETWNVMPRVKAR